MARVTKSLPEINCAKGAAFRLPLGALMPLKALRTLVTLVDPVGSVFGYCQNITIFVG